MYGSISMTFPKSQISSDESILLDSVILKGQDFVTTRGGAAGRGECGRAGRGGFGW